MDFFKDYTSGEEAQSDENTASGFTDPDLTVVPRHSRSPDLNNFNFEEFLGRTDLSFMDIIIDTPIRAPQAPQRQVSTTSIGTGPYLITPSLQTQVSKNCPSPHYSQCHTTAIPGASTQIYENPSPHVNYFEALPQRNYGYPAPIPFPEGNKFFGGPQHDYRYPATQVRIPEEVRFDVTPRDQYGNFDVPRVDTPSRDNISDSNFVTIPRAKYERLLEFEQNHSVAPANPNNPKVSPKSKKLVKPQERDRSSFLSSISNVIFEDKKYEKNKRPSNIRELKPINFYQALPIQRENWQEPANGCEFNYTANGELDLAMKFDVKTLESFIYYHPLAKYGKGLTLWVQCVPADSGTRYPTVESSKCRFEGCPILKNTIRKGEFRVCFDEWDWHPDAARKDPYHNAGYVHLYCLEKFVDFPQLCKTGLVKGDNRELREGRNKMAITRDHPSMLQVVDDFIASSASLPVQGRNPNWFQNSLTFALTKEHIKLQPKARQSVRESRNGASIDKHMNNLDDMVRLRGIVREPRPAKRTGGLPQSRKRKQPEPDTPSSSTSSKENDLFPDPFDSDDSIPRATLAKRRKTTQPPSWTHAPPPAPRALSAQSPRRPGESNRDRLARQQVRLMARRSGRW